MGDDPKVPAIPDVGVEIPEPEERYEKRMTGSVSLAQKDVFLAALRKGWSMTGAANIAKVDHRRLYEERKADSEFAKQWEDAIEAGTDALEDAARRRAEGGLLKKKFTSKGEPIIDPKTGEQYVEREYSDNLTMFLLKGRRPQKYRENINVGGAFGVAVRAMTPEEAVESIRRDYLSRHPELAEDGRPKALEAGTPPAQTEGESR